MTTMVDAAVASRQEVRAWAKALMAGRVLDEDSFLFDQILHTSVLDSRSGYLRCQYSTGALGKAQLRRTVKSFYRLKNAGVLRFVDAGQMLLIYIPKKVATWR